MLVPYIQQCFDLYQTTFPEKWIDEYSDDTNEEKLFEGITKIDRFYRDAFILLSKAVLSGEYAINPRYAAIMSVFLRAISIEASISKIGEKYAELNGDLKEGLNHFYHLITWINDKINNDEVYYFEAYAQQKKDIANQYPLDFIALVLEIARIDHFFIGDKDNRIALILIQRELRERIKIENEELKTIYRALFDKCNFLLKKVFYGPDIHKLYKLDSERYDIDEVVSGESLLKEMSNRYDYLYDINGFSASSFSSEIRDYQNNSFRKASKACELVLLMKHYKKDKVSGQQANNLLNSFNELYRRIYGQKINGEFNLLALNSIKNYLYNSKFAIDLAQPDYSFEQLKNDITQLEQLQSETAISNYFPFYKALKYLSIKIQDDISKDRPDINAVDEELSYYKKLLSKFEDSLNWCIRKKYYPFQLLFNECVVTTEHITIFVASSFARPVDYSKLQKRLQDYKLKQDFLKYQKEFAKEKLEVIKVKESIKTQEKRNFEYLGIFIAVITFLFASIPTFSSHELSLQNALLSILSLGAVLVLFVLMLKVFQDFSNKATVRWWFIVTLILFGGIFICLRLGIL